VQRSDCGLESDVIDHDAHHIHIFDITLQNQHQEAMRTTLQLEDDAMREILVYAKERSLSLGQAASELIRRGSRFSIGYTLRKGVPVFDVPDDFPVLTDEDIKRALDEE
jgi:hypothetical protein